ncbi:MAG: excinuclease ABC subunit UvrC [Bacteroidota bacterium]
MDKTYYTPQQVNLLPTDPGVYHFYDSEKKLIYVGKAKNLKKRVSSYFKQHHHIAIKTRKMVEKIKQISLILVNSEYEALLLENNLIKQYQPRYNILLKDSKNYPYLCVTQEPFPRLLMIRQRNSIPGVYFGPFTSSTHLDQIRSLIKELYPLRTCKYHLSADNIAKKKFKVCLEYHIGNCLGPCEGKQSADDYQIYINHICNLLKGHFQPVKKALMTAAKEAAKKRNYIVAQKYKEKMMAVENYEAKSLIVHPTLGDADVIVITEQELAAFVHYFYLQQGSIVFAETSHIQKKLSESAEEIIALALCHFRDRAQSQATTVLSNLCFSPLPKGVTLTIPEIGDKRKLVDLAMKNVFFFQKELLNKKTQEAKPRKSILMLLQQDLNLQEVPMHIECFDNSNLQGTSPVAAMVCFKQGKPAKRLYRHFHVKSVVGPDDFASMKEIVKRHYQRQVEEHAALPDLILIDGGKGQLGAAVAALQEVGIYHQVAIIAIAKKLEILYKPDEEYPIYINKKSSSLQLLQKIRDEAHRFAISFHRQIRNKQSIESELMLIPGIGPVTLEKLLQHFGSVQNIKKASKQALIEQVGSHKADVIRNYFQ